MEPGSPSRTAWAAAAHRAAHQVLDNALVFRDPLALRILGTSEEEVRLDERHRRGTRMRLFIAMRTRLAEDLLVASVGGNGVCQLVVLGAGLDTFAYRSPFGERLRIFEVDHPATQQWKRDRLAAAGIALPSWLTFAPVDFERETLAVGLDGAGFDPRARTFFTWMGVVPYLTEPAIFATLGYIGALPGGAHVVFDYGEPPDTLSPEARALHDRRAQRVAELGEPWVTYFDPSVLAERLKGVGLPHIEDFGTRELLIRYMRGTTGAPPPRGGHVVHARTL